MGLSTIDDLATFCEANMLRLNHDEYAAVFEHPPASLPSPSESTSSSSPPAEVELSQNETWHTPAAKRPLKKPVTPPAQKSKSGSRSKSKKES